MYYKEVGAVNEEILEMYLALSEAEKEEVRQLIFSLLKSESYYPQAPCLQD